MFFSILHIVKHIEKYTPTDTKHKPSANQKKNRRIDKKTNKKAKKTNKKKASGGIKNTTRLLTKNNTDKSDNKGFFVII